MIIAASRPDALKCRVLRRHLTLQALAQTADAATALTITRFLLLELHAAGPRDLLVALLVSLGPAVLALPVAWMVADSGCKMRSLAATQVLRAGVSIAAVMAMGTGSALAGFSVIGMMTALQTIAGSMRSAVLPRAVPTTRLVAANSLCAITGKIAGTIGVALALGVRVIDPRAVLLVAAALHIASANGYRSWRLDLGERGVSVPIFRAIADETRSLLRVPTAVQCVPMALVIRLVQGGVVYAAVNAVHQQRSDSAAVNAMMLGIVATGGFVGTAVAPNVLSRLVRNGHHPQGAGVAALAVVLLGTFVPSVPARLIALLGVSVLFGLSRVQADSVIQSTASNHVMGRLLATHDAAYQVALVLGVVLTSSVGLTAPNGFVVPASLTLMTLVGVIAIRSPRRRRTS